MTFTGKGGTRLVECPRYDFTRVYVSYVALIDALTAGNGGESMVGTRHGFGPCTWPKPGKGVAAQVWDNMKTLYDVVDEPLVHRFGSLSLECFLLGKTWCVRDSKTGAITTPDGLPTTHLPTTPLIRVCGREQSPGCYDLPTDREVSRVVAAFARPDIASLGLGLDVSDGLPTFEGGPRAQFCIVSFPFATYGAGLGPQRVRCVDKGGGEVPLPD